MIWPSIYLAQIGYPFPMAKLHKASLPMINFFQRGRYFAFLKKKVLFRNTKKVMFLYIKDFKTFKISLFTSIDALKLFSLFSDNSDPRNFENLIMEFRIGSHIRKIGLYSV